MSETRITTTQTVWPALRYRDAHAAIDFLGRAFGFEKIAVYEDDGLVMHAQLALPASGGIMLGSDRDDSAISALPAGTGSVYVVVPDPDALYERARAAGATIVRGLVDEDYGSRGFTCTDPEGVLWSFGTYGGEA
ncbi:glyoxalase [Rhodococcus rhodnii]|uniref:VOC domain-containing protein n=2 Tax=Rhodococcus rhodnii TaxID=38312 RepID=R7WPX0_9NOCA|nr:VOC family protein [Rhodococcus rhodnii]EOM77366.1 hypothetical protein Rrhod_1319 [Rhodococcus rhodnii LMG 5362]TXG91736.1 glyoxalase [Rhodococcus rhodnii]